MNNTSHHRNPVSATAKATNTRWLTAYSDGTAAAIESRLAYAETRPEGALATLRIATEEGELRVAYLDGPGRGEVLNFRELPPHHPDRPVLARALAGRDHCLMVRHSSATGEPCVRVGDGLVATTTTGEELFPRIDPAVMVLLRSPDDEWVLLANNVTWERERFSTVAGFVDAGESLEETCRRECYEEVGLEIDTADFRYLFSDVWPFPRSLMVGFAAVASVDVVPHYPDGEIREARWLSRAEIRESLPGGGPLILPNAGSLSRRMITAWLDGTLPA